mgnify:CR=1 FL=1
MKKLAIKFDIRTYTMIFALIALWIYFGITEERFIAPQNFSNVFNNMSLVALLAIGMVLIIVAGHIDLSVGSVVGFTGAVTTLLYANYNWSPYMAVCAGLATGMLVGLVQGYITAYLGVPAFIVTLGGLLMFRGATIWVLKGVTVSLPEGWVRGLGVAYLPREFGIALTAIAVISVVVFFIWNRNSRKRYGFVVDSFPVTIAKIIVASAVIIGFVFVLESYKGIPMAFILLLFLALFVGFLVARTPFGRHVFAIGGNKEAAKLSGINVKHRVMMVFVLMGFLSAVAGIVFAAKTGSANPKNGELYELYAIASCVIGGTSMAGGKGTIIGAVVGALLMASLDYGMFYANWENSFQYIAKGLVLIIAVFVDVMSQKDKSD